jgi:hypothetical protein
MNPRKYLFCADAAGTEFLYSHVQKAIEDKVSFDFRLIEEEEDSFINLWLSQQKMGSQLYLSGKNEFVKRLKQLALAAGFSEYEMKINICGLIKKKLICCTCHGVNEVEDERLIICNHCGVELEVSCHYSSRLDAYLGYVTIK